jgi:hypothetical protein
MKMTATTPEQGEWFEDEEEEERGETGDELPDDVEALQMMVTNRHCNEPTRHCAFVCILVSFSGYANAARSHLKMGAPGAE